MSKTRIVLRIVLVVLTIGVAAIAYFQWAKSRPDYYFRRAEAAIADEDFTAARINLVRLLHGHPQHAEGHALLSRVILQEARAKNQPASFAAQPAAVKHLEEAAKLRPADQELQRRLLGVYLEIRYYGDAARVAEPIYADDKTSGDAHFALTWRAVNSKDSAAAERLFDEFAGVVSRLVFHEYAIKAMYYSDRQELDKLKATLLEAIQMAARLKPEDLQMLARRDREVMLQLLFFAQGQATAPETAIRVSQLIVELCEQLSKENLLGAELLAQYSGQSQAALEKGLSTTPLDEQQRFLREQLVDRADALVAKALKDDSPASPAVVYWTKARSLMSEGRVADALAAIEKGIDDWERVPPEQRPAGDEEQLQLRLLAARLLVINQRYDEVEPHLAQLDGHEEYQGWVHLMRGQKLLRQGEFAEARDELKRAERFLGKQIELSTSLAHAHSQLQEYEQAVKYLELLLAPEEDLSEDEKVWRRLFLDQRERVHFELLRSRLKLNRWQEAQDNLRQLRDSQLAPQAWYLVVDYLWQTKQGEKAREYLRRAREVFPNDIELLFLDANLLSAAGQQDSAELLFTEFVEAGPNDPVRRLAQARWSIYSGRPDKALRTLSTLDDHPSLTQKLQNTHQLFRAQALIEEHRYDEALAATEALIAQPGTAAAGYLLQAVVAWKRSDPQRGAELLARARSADQRKSGLSRKTMNVVGPGDEVIGVTILDAYYW